MESVHMKLIALIQQVRNIWRAWRVSRALKVLNKYNISYKIETSTPVVLEEVTELQLTVNQMVEQVEQKFKRESGEFKRSQVLRAVLNILPDALERDISFAIEKRIKDAY